MATVIKAELSKKNKYYIDKHRHYELKHFCLQYPMWKKAYADLDGFAAKPDSFIFSKTNIPGNPTAKYVEEREYYFNKMKLVEQTAIAADPDIASYILKSVTEGLSFTHLKSRLEIPCGRDLYYDRYRRFFWLLDKIKE